MASNIKVEEENYLRVAFLLLRISPAAVRIKFDKVFPAVGLQTLLYQKKTQVLDGLKVRRVINQKQWDLLFPNQGTTKSETFDVTLMICLLRNLTNIQIQDPLPASYDTSEGADLSRIKYYRNRIVHSDDAVLSNQDFSQIWNEISQAISRLGGPSYVQICQDHKTCNLDNNDRELLNEIRNISKDIIPKGLQGILDDKIKQWKSLESKIVETSAIRHVMEMIEKKDCVTVVGPSGSGKSTAIHHVALHYKQYLSYKIIPVNFPKEITEFYDPDTEQMFVFDDIYGKFSLDSHRLMDWCTLSGNIKKILEEKHVKILASCRTNIYRDRKFPNCVITSEAICDLISDNLSLSLDERWLIAKSHLTKEEVERLQGLKGLPLFDFFPLLCKIYSTKKPTTLEKFFSSPISVMKDELLLLKASEDQTAYATLALFVIYNNCITEDKLSKYPGIKIVLEDISGQCELKSVFNIKVVQLQFEKLINTYIKKLDGTYTIIHDKVFDILVSFYGEHMFDVILDHCTSSFLSERVRFESILDSEEEFGIKVPANTEQKYFKRLLRDIKEEKVVDVFCSRSLLSETHEKKFLKFLKDGSGDRHNNLLQFSSFVWSTLLMTSTQGWCLYVKVFIERNLDLNFKDNQGQTPLHLACKLGRPDIVQLLLENGSKPYIRNSNNLSPFHVALSFGCLDIVKLMLPYNDDIDLCCGCQKSPLFLAGIFGYTDIAQFLIDSGCVLDISDKFYKTPLYVATKFNSKGIVEMLLRNGCTPNPYTDNMDSPLFAAIDNDSRSICKLLLDYGADPNICRLYYDSVSDTASKDLDDLDMHFSFPVIFLQDIKENFPTDKVLDNFLDVSRRLSLNKLNGSPVLKACTRRYSDASIIKLLFMYNGDFNVVDKDGNSPLILASQVGNEDIVKFLLEQIMNQHSEVIPSWANPNFRNNEGETSLFVGCKNGHVDVVKILLRNGAELEMGDQNNRTPLYIATEQGHVLIVKLMLEYGANPNVIYDDNFYTLPIVVASNIVQGKIFEHVSMMQERVDSWSRRFQNHQISSEIVRYFLNEVPSDEVPWRQYIDIVKLLLQYKAKPFFTVYDMTNAL